MIPVLSSAKVLTSERFSGFDRGNKKPSNKDHAEKTKTMVLLVIKKGRSDMKRKGAEL